MCKCTPNLRTPFCNNPGCKYPNHCHRLHTSTCILGSNTLVSNPKVQTQYCNIHHGYHIGSLRNLVVDYDTELDDYIETYLNFSSDVDEPET